MTTATIKTEIKISHRKNSPSTIRKAFDVIDEILCNPDFVEKAAQMQSVCSAGNSKIGYTLNVSIAPIFTCPGRSVCQSYCYALKFFMKEGFNTKEKLLNNKWVLNTVLSQNDPKKYFSLIKSDIEKSWAPFFRWHVGGDITGGWYFDGMIDVSDSYPKTTFLAMTKSYGIINKYFSDHGIKSYSDFKKDHPNFNLYFSRSRSDEEINNPYGIPENMVICSEEEMTSAIENKSVFICGGSCARCQYANTGCFEKAQSKVVAFINHN